MLLEQYIDYSLKSYLSEDDLQKVTDLENAKDAATADDDLQVIQELDRYHETEGWVLKKGNELIITCRGTDSFNDVAYNVSLFLTDIGRDRGKVHSGFWNNYKRIGPSLKDLLDMHVTADCTSITFVGHSLGATVCIFGALECSFMFPEKSITCITFGAPKIGDRKFCSLFERQVPDAFRVVNPGDVVPKIPTLFLYHTHGLWELTSENKDKAPCLCDMWSYYYYIIRQHSLYTYRYLAVSLTMDSDDVMRDM